MSEGTHHFRSYITFESIDPFPRTALRALGDAISCLQRDSADPSAVGTSTEPTFRSYLFAFFRAVAEYSQASRIRREGSVETICEFDLDTLRVHGVEDLDESREGSLYDRTVFAIATREPLGYPPGESS